MKPYLLRRGAEEGVPPKLSLDYGQALNPQQLAAVMAGDGPALVIAGAGSDGHYDVNVNFALNSE